MQNNLNFHYCHMQQVRSSEQIRATKILNLIPKCQGKIASHSDDARIGFKVILITLKVRMQARSTLKYDEKH